MALRLKSICAHIKSICLQIENMRAYNAIGWEGRMARIAALDGTMLHFEETGSGTPVVFVHEFAGDHRSWEPQMRFFARSHRCVSFAARGETSLPHLLPLCLHTYTQK